MILVPSDLKADEDFKTNNLKDRLPAFATYS